MTTVSQLIQNISTRVGTEFKALRTNELGGPVSGLATTAKTIIGAINELKAGQANAAGISDSTTTTSSTWSSSKVAAFVSNAIATVKSDLLGGAGATYDSFQELKGLLDQVDADADSAVAALMTAVGNRVRFDDAQTLTTQQAQRARDNIAAAAAADLGDLTIDPVATFNTALQ